MVLDTRFLTDKHPVTASTPKTVTGSTSGRGDGAPQAWAELLQAAVETPQAERFAELVQRLRQMLPGEGGVAALWAMLSDPADHRRRLAALVLGYHRAWLASRSRLRGMVALATSEADPQVARAMVWTLRQQDEVAPFLAHRDEGVAREAALGVPLNRHCVAAVVRALLLDLHPQPGVESVLLERLGQLHPSCVADVVGCLLQAGVQLCPVRLSAAFSRLPQVPLFQLLVEERQLPEWDARQEADAHRARRWQELVAAARQVVAERPALELARYLLTRCSEDEAFARRHARLLRTAMQRTDPGGGGGLVAHFGRLGQRASEDRVARLAQLLVDLSERLQGQPEGEEARSLLETWKNRSAVLRLRIYQMQNKLSGA